MEAGIRRNLTSETIIRNDICNGSPPKEINELLTMITNNVHRSLYHVQTSLIPLSTYHAAFKEMFDVIRFVLHKNLLMNLLNELPH